MDTDPDASDHAALETAAELPLEPPIGEIEDLDLAAATEEGMRVGSLRFGRADMASGTQGSSRGPQRFSRLFESPEHKERGLDSNDSNSDTSSSGLDDEEDEDVGTEGGKEDDEDAFNGEHELEEYAGSYAAGMPELPRRRSQKERKRRPSTTEAKVRRPLEEDEDPDFAGGRDETLDVGNEGEGEGATWRHEGEYDGARGGSDEGPFADPVDLGSSEEEDSSDEDIVEIRSRRTS